jgi:hypothetical protein
LANEKRGGLKVVVFGKSPFKIFILRFSTKSVQAPSCERPKTTQQTLFLSLEINNYFLITVKCRRFIKKSGKLACHVENSNIAIGSLPALQTSHELLALFEKIYYGEPIFTDFSNIGEDVQYLYGNCSSQPPHLTEELPQWLSGPSLVLPTAE